MVKDQYPADDSFEGDLELRERPALETTLRALRESEEGSLSSVIFYGLSNLDPAEIERVKPVWEMLSAERRLQLVRQMTDLSEMNVDLDYNAIGSYALTDANPEVREAAIDMLWEDESLGLMARFIEMAQWDESVSVRAAAASALGRFILLGELGDLPESQTMEAQEVAISLYSDEEEDVEVRRRALEAISNCGHEMVEEFISEAYNSSDERMRASAVFAMGCTCDDRWSDIVLREIGSPDPAMCYEAARASGQLELAEAVPHLVRLARQNDREIQQAAVWSLGEIGGTQAVKMLTVLAEEADQAGDEDMLELIEDAIGNASLVGDDFDFDFDELNAADE